MFVYKLGRCGFESWCYHLDIEYPKEIHELYSDLTFLPERIKIDKCNKFIANLNDKNNYVVHIRALKEALNHGSISKKCIK